MGRRYFRFESTLGFCVIFSTASKGGQMIFCIKVTMVKYAFEEVLESNFKYVILTVLSA